MSLDLVKVLSPETDRKIGEAADAVTSLCRALAMLVQLITTIVTKARS